MQRCPLCHSPALDLALSCPTCGALLETDGEALASGTLLRGGAYRVERVLGQGGYGITYLAHDTGLSSLVALKELYPEGTVQRGAGATVRPLHPGRVTDFEADKRAAFREAQLLYHLRDPSIVPVHSVWEENNTVYLALEYLEGETLGQRLRRGSLGEAEAHVMLRRVLEGLSKVHAQGVLHRDLKPDNLMLSVRLGPVLIDFGNARRYSGGQGAQTKLIATPAYAAPEQFSSSALLSPATDLYGLAATFYHALGGVPPVQAPERMLGASLPRLADLRPDLGAAWVHTLEQALSLHVAQRPPSARAWLALLPPVPTAGAAGTSTIHLPTPLPTVPSSPPTVRVSPTASGAMPTSRRSRGLGLVLGLGILGAVGAGVAVLGRPTPAANPAPPTVTRSGTAPPAGGVLPAVIARPQTPARPVSPGTPAPVQAAPLKPPPAQAASTAPSGTLGFAPSQVEIAVGRLNVRSGPSLGAPALSRSGQPLQLALGQVAPVGRTQAGWTEVNVDGQLGWVLRRLTVPLGPQVSSRALDALVLASRQGGRLSLERGVYRLPAGLRVTAPLELVGQGMDQTYLISSAASPTVQAGVSLSLRGLTVAHHGPAPTAVLRQTAGSLTLNGVRVIGGRDDARNRPEDGDAGDGLVVAGDARAEVSASELIANRWRGLHGLGRSSIRVQGSAFEVNSGSGLMLEDASAARVLASRAALNDLAGFKPVDRATLALSGTALSGNGNAVYLSDSATVTLTSNVCSGNAAGDVVQAGGRLEGLPGNCAVVRPAPPARAAAPPSPGSALASPIPALSSVPAFVPVEEVALNYALSVPGGWIRSSATAATQRDTWHHPVDPRIKVLVEVSSTYGGDPLVGWQALDAQMRAKYKTRYRVLDLSAQTSSGVGQSARWEFLLEQGGETLRKVDLAAGRDGRGYAVLVQAPAAQWAQYGPPLEAVLESFRFLR